jgi:virulence-associated protein VapD
MARHPPSYRTIYHVFEAVQGAAYINDRYVIGNYARKHQNVVRTSCQTTSFEKCETRFGFFELEFLGQIYSFSCLFERLQ